MSLILFAIAIMSVACSKVDNNLRTDLLEGVWVNSVTETDTLDFSVKPSFTNSPNVFQLKRGAREIEGNSIPKVGSGYYEYIIAGNKILIKGLIIDVHSGNEYAFNHSEDSRSLKIGSFAPFEGGQPIYEFVRIDR